jgi:glucose/arabinose dehydrogenase
VLAALAACAAIVGLTLGGCAFGPPAPDEAGAPPNLPPASPSASPSADSAASSLEVVATKVPAPWGIAFLPDGSALVTERVTGTILRVAPPLTPTGLTATRVATVAGVDGTGDGGLLGIAVSPHYATDSTIYVYYSTAHDNRVGSVGLRLTQAAPTATPSGPTPTATAPTGPVPTLTPHPIVTGIPHAATDNGGALAFGPDGLLYASTGDAGHPKLAPDRKSLAGKILRFTTTGKAASGNPVAGALPYAYGAHDIEGFAWSVTGQMFAIDAGRSTDGLFRVSAGTSFGWPDGPGATPTQTFALAGSTCAGLTVVDNLIATACPTGRQAWVMQLTGPGTVFGAPVPILAGTYGRLRAIATAPDGSLWIATSNTDGHGDPAAGDDRILRLVLADAGAGKS